MKRALAALLPLTMAVSTAARAQEPAMDFVGGTPPMTDAFDAARSRNASIAQMQRHIKTAKQPAVPTQIAKAQVAPVKLDLFNAPPVMSGSSATVPVAATSPAPVAPVRQATAVPIQQALPRHAVSACDSRDITVLLSPRCLSELKIPTVADRTQEPSKRCSFLFKPSGDRSSPTSSTFASGSLAGCVETSVRLTYSMPGTLNVVVADSYDTGPEVEYVCERPMADGKSVSCRQQATMGEVR